MVLIFLQNLYEEIEIQVISCQSFIELHCLKYFYYG